MSKGSLTILGLGPGPAGLLSLEAMERLRASTVILRTKIHPCVSDLEAAGVRYTSCDDLYETGQSFEDVYRSITERVLAAARTEDVVYAVPGSPLVAEKTVLLLRDAAREAGVPLTIKPALSFLDLAYVALGIDPINGLRIIDAQDYEALADAGRYPLMVTQVYSPMVASDLKLAVMDVLPDDTEIWFLRNLGLPDEECRKIPLFEADRQPHIDHLTSIFIPPEAPLPAGEDTAAGGDPGTVPEAGKWLTDEDPYTPEEAQEDLENGEDAVWAEYSPLRRKTAFDIRPLADMIQTLREPNGCPWDREQDFHSIRANFIEECYEYLEALDQGDLDGMKEELGDVLMQVVFHARMAEEKGFFTLQDVVRPLDAGMDAFVFVDSLDDGHGGHQGALGGFLRQEGRFQDHADPDTAAVGREPAPGKAALAARLFFRDNGHAVGAAIGSQFFAYFVRGVRRFHVVDVVSHPLRMEMRHDFFRAQKIRGAPKDVALLRNGLDFIAQIFQGLDMFPDRRTGNAQLRRNLFPRNRFRRAGP